MILKNPVTNVASRSDPVPSDGELLQQCQGIVRQAAEPWAPGEGVEAGIRRAARRTGLSYRRTRTFWYAQPCRLLALEVERLRVWHGDWLSRRHARLSAEIEVVLARKAELQALATERRGPSRP